MSARKREKQMRYLSQALQLEEAVNPHIVMATMTMVSLAIVVFIVWAGFTNINEVARTPGEVVPAGYQQTVQHLEGGIVSDILVREDGIVEKGEVLVVVEDSGVRQDLGRALSKQLSLDMQAERLRAFTEGRTPDFSRFPGAEARMIADQQTFFDGMVAARRQEEQVIRDQVAQKKQTLDVLQSSLDTARENLKVAQDLYGRRLTLNQKGYASDIQLLNDRRQLNDAKGQIAQLESQAVVSRSELKEFEARLDSLAAEQRDEAHQKLDQVLAEKDQNAKIIDKLNERIGRMEIRAPVRGLVKGLAINTIGEVVKPGQTIMEIVPVDEKLEVQVRIAPKDIGHLSTGQAVQVKFSTYDFSRYGLVQGRLDRISATTFTGERGERYYEGLVRLDRNYVGNDPANMILPGMTVMADVITGRKTILQYLLKPVQVATQTAFTER